MSSTPILTLWVRYFIFSKQCWHGGVFSALTRGVENKSGVSRRTDLSSLNPSTSLKRTVAARHVNTVMLTATTLSIAKGSSVFLSVLSPQMEPPDVLLVSDASFFSCDLSLGKETGGVLPPPLHSFGNIHGATRVRSDPNCLASSPAQLSCVPSLHSCLFCTCEG